MVFHENVLRISSFLDWKAIRMAGVICKSWRFGAMNRWPLNEVVLDRWTQWDERNTKKPSFIKKWSEIRTALRQDRIRSVHIIRNIHGHLEPSEQEQERQILSNTHARAFFLLIHSSRYFLGCGDRASHLKREAIMRIGSCRTIMVTACLCFAQESRPGWLCFSFLLF